ncbi:hypothetical protein [Paenibacillus pinihumi]|uniref:hypothetical protein n=1 Tax=Paenibacillus pinihumi TaxID=669462 RepID=UPI000422F70C|nr:hypothetical protein [Paenibacillus pinihumi]
MTPHELNLHLEIYYENKRLADDQSITLAYLTAYWHRVKKMPELKTLLSTGQRKEMTDEEMLQIVKDLTLAAGGKITYEGRD